MKTGQKNYFITMNKDNNDLDDIFDEEIYKELVMIVYLTIKETLHL